MVCSCFRGQKDLDHVSAPLEPAVPKPAPASNGPQANLAQLRHASRQHLAPSTSGGRSFQAAVPTSAATPTGGDLSHQGPAAAPNAGPDVGDAQAENDPHAVARKRPTIVIPGSPSSPPAQPKAAHWNISPVQQEAQAEAADVEDIEVDLEEVQELSPIPTSTPSPASANGTPENMFRRGQGYQPSPSNLGPRRSQAQSASALSTTDKEEEEEDEEEPEEEGTHEVVHQGTPPGLPPTIIHSEQQQPHDTHLQQQQQESPARLQPHESHSDGNQMSVRSQSGTPVKPRLSTAPQGNVQQREQVQQSPARPRLHANQQQNQQELQKQQQREEESSDWDEDKKGVQANGSSRKQEARRSSWDESSSAASTPTPHKQQQAQAQSWRSNGAWSDKQQMSRAAEQSSAASKQGSCTEQFERSSLSEDESAASPVRGPAPLAPIGGRPKTGTEVDSTPVVSPRAGGDASRSDTPLRSPQLHAVGARLPSRRTALGPHAPTRPSPLGGGETPRRALARQISNLSDCSDLSLPGEYERYGEGSSEDEEAADRQYEEALALAGGQVGPGATARNTASNNVTPGPAPGAAASATVTPRMIGTVSPPAPASSGMGSAMGPTARSTGFANPIWGEGEEEDSDSPESSQRSSQPQSARPPPTASRFQKMHLAAQQQATSPQHARRMESDFDSDSETDSDSDWDSNDRTPVRTVPKSGRRLGGFSHDSEEDGDVQGTPERAESIKWIGVYNGPAGDSESPSPQPQSSLGGAIPMNSFAAAAAAVAATTAALGAAAPAEAKTPRQLVSATPSITTTHEPSAPSAPVPAPAPVTATSTTAPEAAPPSGDMIAVVASLPLTTAATIVTAPTEPKELVNSTSVPRESQPQSARQSVADANNDGAKSMSATPTKAPTAPSSSKATASSATAAPVTKAPIPARTSLSTPAASAQKPHAAASTVSPSTSTGNNVPHFMMPTRSATARRSSEEGNTPHPANGASSGANATHTGAAITSARSSSASNTSARASVVKLPSPANSGALPRPPGPAPLARTPSGRQLAGQTSGTPPTAPKSATSTATTTATTTPSTASVAAKTPATIMTGTTASKPAASSGIHAPPAAPPGPKPGPASVRSSTAAPSAATKPTSTARASGKAAGGGTSEGASTASSHPSKPAGGAPSTSGRVSAASSHVSQTPTGPASNGAKRASVDGAKVEPPSAAASKGQVAAPKAAGQQPTAAPTPAPAPPPPSGGGGLPFGEWRVVRLKKEMRCCAGDGTVEQETHDGQMEVFQCEEMLQPGALAAVISHNILPADGAAPQPKTWVFCPDPLCMESKPVGSDLPQWPPKIILAGGVKVTRAEYDHLKDLGLDVMLATKAPAPAAPSAG